MTTGEQGGHWSEWRARRSRGTVLALALSVAALVIVPAAALGVAGDFTQPATSPEAAGTAPRSVVAANLNGDASTDLAVANQTSNNVTILLGNGAGDFTAAATSPEAAGMNPASVTAANLGGDASTDLAVTNFGSDNVTILLGDGSGNFTEVPTTSPEAVGDGPRSVAAANLNGDASTDLAVVNLLSHNVTILLGDGSGNFTPVPATSPEAVGQNPSSVAAANFNGDASTDLAVANQTSGSVTILLGNGAGDFTEVPTTSPETAGLNPRSIAAANLGGDASTDLAVVNLGSDNVTILLGDGAGDFTAPGTSPEAVGGAPAAVAAANLNGDASSDLAVVNGNDDNVTILLGDGSGEFTAAGSSPETAGDGPAAVAAANLNGDASSDLAVVNGDDHNVTILLAELAPPVITPVVPPAPRPPRRSARRAGS